MTHAIIERNGKALAHHVELARSLWARNQGLLGRARLDDGDALYLPGCGSIHTFFMRFNIDIVFLDGKKRVVRIEEGVPPWRFLFAPLGRDVLELSRGRARRCGLKVGDRITIEESHA